MLQDEIERLPATVSNKPVAEHTPAELLAETTRQGLMRVLEIVSVPITADTDPKVMRLRGEMGLGAAKLYRSVAEAHLCVAKNDEMEELWAAIEKYQTKEEASAELASNKATVVTDQ